MNQADNAPVIEWDYVIIGSGFGGSVSALRLVEKGYRVLLLEKGQRFPPARFPRSNWDLRRWLWMPRLGWRGLFNMTFFRHVTVLSGVGVGGGSLVYANTLPIPKDDFFTAPSWGHLAEWKAELQPHYETVRRMLGAVQSPLWTEADKALAHVASDLGKSEQHHKTHVGVYFGTPGETVADPYFAGQGPDRTGCIMCGGCLLGCRHNAKNTLDKNYLHLAEGLGLEIRANTEVTWVKPLSVGYEIECNVSQSMLPWRRQKVVVRSRNVVFAGGVLGSVQLLLKLQQHEDGLPKLSPRLGEFVRTNSESLIGVVSHNNAIDMTQGIAITSILHTDAHSHVEPVRYPRGSGFFRAMTLPHVHASTSMQRIFKLFALMMRRPLRFLRLLFIADFAKQSLILLYMRTLDGHLRLLPRRRWFGRKRKQSGMRSAVAQGKSPAAYIPEASDIAERVASRLDGVTMSLVNETLFNIPTTAHILGGCCMGQTAEEGVVDAQHRVFNYEGLYVIDGSAVSANPGVNPSLSIAALAERAMTFISSKA